MSKSGRWTPSHYSQDQDGVVSRVMPMPTLIVLGGLPATGKSTVAREVMNARPQIGYIRVDSIEQALRFSGEMGSGGVQGAGYAVAYAVVRDLLRTLPLVLAECVNPIDLTRKAWAEVATSSNAQLLEVELYCSDPLEHRARAQARTTDVPGL